MPDPETCIQSPGVAPVPAFDNLSALYAVTVALSIRANKSNSAAITRYLGRLPKEFDTVGVTDAIVRDESLSDTTAFRDWAVANTKIAA